MAVDRPGDYVGNHGGAYTDDSGMSKQFTYVDHDPKIKISGSVTTDKEKETIKSSLLLYKKELVQRILDVSASFCPIEFSEFTLRTTSKIEWNKKMLSDNGMSIDRLRDICTIVERRSEAYPI